MFATTSPRELRRLVSEFAGDDRAGVQALVQKARNAIALHSAERRRLRAMAEVERSLREDGSRVVAGLDEVGRGALAGPVTVAAVVLPPDAVIEGLNDSKLLDPTARERMAEEIRAVAQALFVAHAAAHIIDAIGISAAIRGAMEHAIVRLPARPDHVVTDGRPFGLSVPETAIVRGDSSVAAIAAASIVAKVERDTVMRRLAASYPQWSFESNKGYGTSEHIAAISARGLSIVHRRSFAPCGGQSTLF